MALIVESTGFKQGNMIPRRYTCDGEDVSPAMRWSGSPAGTKCFALICDDPDAPMMTWVHWVIYSIPASVSELKEALPTTGLLSGGIKQGRNSGGSTGYSGPCPPGKKPHRYFFKLYALDSELDIPPGADKKYLEKAMKGHVLAQAEIMGMYGR